MPRGKKVTQLELQRRLEQISEWLIQGASTSEIYQYAREKGWDVCNRQIDNYISKCYDLWNETLEKNRERLLAKHIRLRERLYFDAMREKDYQNRNLALNVLKDMAALFKLYDGGIQKHEIVIKGAPEPEEIPPDNPEAGINGED